MAGQQLCCRRWERFVRDFCVGFVVFAAGQVRRGEVFELFRDVISTGVVVSGFSWSVGELAAVNLATKVADSRPTLARFRSFLNQTWESKVIFSYNLTTVTIFKCRRLFQNLRIYWIELQEVCWFDILLLLKLLMQYNQEFSLLWFYQVV